MRKSILSLLVILLISACSSNPKNDPAVAPASATLISPIKDQICTTGTITSVTQSTISFAWSSATNADSYDVTTTNLLTQTSATTTVSTTQATISLLQNTPYSWYVTSKSSKSNSTAKSDVWKFYNSGAGVVTYPPFPATIKSPTLGQIVTTTNGTVNLTWGGSSVTNNIVAYKVYFGPSNNPDLFKNNITDSFINGISVSASTTYYWHIITIDANGNSSDSGLFNFFVKQ
jgi:hypothetical protein